LRTLWVQAKAMSPNFGSALANVFLHAIFQCIGPSIGTRLIHFLSAQNRLMIKKTPFFAVQVKVGIAVANEGHMYLEVLIDPMC